ASRAPPPSPSSSPPSCFSAGTTSWARSSRDCGSASRSRRRGEPVIKVRGLTKSFAGQPVLRGVDLDMPDRSITVIIGRSGGGKSVFLKHLLGLLRPDSGQVMINGTDITNLGVRAMDEVRQHYGVVFQGGALFDSLTCFDNVAFPLREKTKLGHR